MKLKLSWSTGIVIAMISFMIFILSFVYKAVALDEYQHELVSEDYYKDELHYQEEIDKMNNSIALSKEVTLRNSKTGIHITFPDEIKQAKIKGMITFQRLSNEKLDFSEEIVLSEHEQIIPAEKLVSGKWIIKIDWEDGKRKYLFKESWFY